MGNSIYDEIVLWFRNEFEIHEWVWLLVLDCDCFAGGGSVQWKKKGYLCSSEEVRGEDVAIDQDIDLAIYDFGGDVLGGLRALWVGATDGLEREG